jgi:hypothetical protein
LIAEPASVARPAMQSDSSETLTADVEAPGCAADPDW